MTSWNLLPWQLDASCQTSTADTDLTTDYSLEAFSAHYQLDINYNPGKETVQLNFVPRDEDLQKKSRDNSVNKNKQHNCIKVNTLCTQDMFMHNTNKATNKSTQIPSTSFDENGKKPEKYKSRRKLSSAKKHQAVADSITHLNKVCETNELPKNLILGTDIGKPPKSDQKRKRREGGKCSQATDLISVGNSSEQIKGCNSKVKKHRHQRKHSQETVTDNLLKEDDRDQATVFEDTPKEKKHRRKHPERTAIVAENFEKESLKEQAAVFKNPRKESKHKRKHFEETVTVSQNFSRENHKEQNKVSKDKTAKGDKGHSRNKSEESRVKHDTKRDKSVVEPKNEPAEFDIRADKNAQIYFMQSATENSHELPPEPRAKNKESLAISNKVKKKRRPHPSLETKFQETRSTTSSSSGKYGSPESSKATLSAGTKKEGIRFFFIRNRSGKKGKTKGDHKKRKSIFKGNKKSDEEIDRKPSRDKKGHSSNSRMNLVEDGKSKKKIHKDTTTKTSASFIKNRSKSVDAKAVKKHVDRDSVEAAHGAGDAGVKLKKKPKKKHNVSLTNLTRKESDTRLEGAYAKSKRRSKSEINVKHKDTSSTVPRRAEDLASDLKPKSSKRNSNKDDQKGHTEVLKLENKVSGDELVKNKKREDNVVDDAGSTLKKKHKKKQKHMNIVGETSEKKSNDSTGNKAFIKNNFENKPKIHDEKEMLIAPNLGDKQNLKFKESIADSILQNTRGNSKKQKGKRDSETGNSIDIKSHRHKVMESAEIVGDVSKKKREKSIHSRKGRHKISEVSENNSQNSTTVSSIQSKEKQKKSRGTKEKTNEQDLKQNYDKRLRYDEYESDITARAELGKFTFIRTASTNNNSLDVHHLARRNNFFSETTSVTEDKQFIQQFKEKRSKSKDKKVIKITKDQLEAIISQINKKPHLKQSKTLHYRLPASEEKTVPIKGIRKEVSFSQLNVKPVLAHYVKPTPIVNFCSTKQFGSSGSYSNAPLFPSFLPVSPKDKKQAKPKKKNKASDYKSVVSEAVTKKEKFQYVSGKRYSTNRTARNFAYSENVIESSRKALRENGSSTIGFTVEGVEPPKMLKLNLLPNYSTKQNVPNLDKQLHSTVLPIIEIISKLGDSCKAEITGTVDCKLKTVQIEAYSPRLLIETVEDVEHGESKKPGVGEQLTNKPLPLEVSTVQAFTNILSAPRRESRRSSASPKSDKKAEMQVNESSPEKDTTSVEKILSNISEQNLSINCQSSDSKSDSALAKAAKQPESLPKDTRKLSKPTQEPLHTEKLAASVDETSKHSKNSKSPEKLSKEKLVALGQEVLVKMEEYIETHRKYSEEENRSKEEEMRRNSSKSSKEHEKPQDEREIGSDGQNARSRMMKYVQELKEKRRRSRERRSSSRKPSVERKSTETENLVATLSNENEKATPVTQDSSRSSRASSISPKRNTHTSVRSRSPSPFRKSSGSSKEAFPERNSLKYQNLTSITDNEDTKTSATPREEFKQYVTPSPPAVYKHKPESSSSERRQSVLNQTAFLERKGTETQNLIPVMDTENKETTVKPRRHSQDSSSSSPKRYTDTSFKRKVSDVTKEPSAERKTRTQSILSVVDTASTPSENLQESSALDSSSPRRYTNTSSVRKSSVSRRESSVETKNANANNKNLIAVPVKEKLRAVATNQQNINKSTVPSLNSPRRRSSSLEYDGSVSSPRRKSSGFHRESSVVRKSAETEKLVPSSDTRDRKIMTKPLQNSVDSAASRSPKRYSNASEYGRLLSSSKEKNSLSPREVEKVKDTSATRRLTPSLGSPRRHSDVADNDLSPYTTRRRSSAASKETSKERKSTETQNLSGSITPRSSSPRRYTDSSENDRFSSPSPLKRKSLGKDVLTSRRSGESKSVVSGKKEKPKVVPTVSRESSNESITPRSTAPQRYSRRSLHERLSFPTKERHARNTRENISKKDERKKQSTQSPASEVSSVKDDKTYPWALPTESVDMELELRTDDFENATSFRQNSLKEKQRVPKNMPIGGSLLQMLPQFLPHTLDDESETNSKNITNEILNMEENISSGQTIALTKITEETSSQNSFDNAHAQMPEHSRLGTPEKTSQPMSYFIPPDKEVGESMRSTVHAKQQALERDRAKRLLKQKIKSASEDEESLQRSDNTDGYSRISTHSSEKILGILNLTDENIPERRHFVYSKIPVVNLSSFQKVKPEHEIDIKSKQAMLQKNEFNKEPYYEDEDLKDKLNENLQGKDQYTTMSYSSSNFQQTKRLLTEKTSNKQTAPEINCSSCILKGETSQVSANESDNESRATVASFDEKLQNYKTSEDARKNNESSSDDFNDNFDDENATTYKTETKYMSENNSVGKENDSDYFSFGKSNKLVTKERNKNTKQKGEPRLVDNETQVADKFEEQFNECKSKTCMRKNTNVKQKETGITTNQERNKLDSMVSEKGKIDSKNDKVSKGTSELSNTNRARRNLNEKEIQQVANLIVSNVTKELQAANLLKPNKMGKLAKQSEKEMKQLNEIIQRNIAIALKGNVYSVMHSYQVGDSGFKTSKQFKYNPAETPVAVVQYQADSLEEQINFALQNYNRNDIEENHRKPYSNSKRTFKGNQRDKQDQKTENSSLNENTACMTNKVLRTADKRHPDCHIKDCQLACCVKYHQSSYDVQQRKEEKKEEVMEKIIALIPDEPDFSFLESRLDDLLGIQHEPLLKTLNAESKKISSSKNSENTTINRNDQKQSLKNPYNYKKTTQVAYTLATRKCKIRKDFLKPNEKNNKKKDTDCSANKSMQANPKIQAKSTGKPNELYSSKKCEPFKRSITKPSSVSPKTTPKNEFKNRNDPCLQKNSKTPTAKKSSIVAVRRYNSKTGIGDTSETGSCRTRVRYNSLERSYSTLKGTNRDNVSLQSCMEEPQSARFLTKLFDIEVVENCENQSCSSKRLQPTPKPKGSSCLYTKNYKSGRHLSAYEKRKRYGESLRNKTGKSKTESSSMAPQVDQTENPECVYYSPEEVHVVTTQDTVSSAPRKKVPPPRPPPPTFANRYSQPSSRSNSGERMPPPKYPSTYSAPTKNQQIRVLTPSERYGYEPYGMQGGHQAPGVDYKKLGAYLCTKVCCGSKNQAAAADDDDDFNTPQPSTSQAKKYPTIPTIIRPVRSKTNQKQNQTDSGSAERANSQEKDHVYHAYAVMANHPHVTDVFRNKFKTESSISLFSRESLFSYDIFSPKSTASVCSVNTFHSRTVHNTKSSSLIDVNNSDEARCSEETKRLGGYRRTARGPRLRKRNTVGRMPYHSSSFCSPSKEMFCTIEQNCRTGSNEDKKTSNLPLLSITPSYEFCHSTPECVHNSMSTTKSREDGQPLYKNPSRIPRRKISLLEACQHLKKNCLIDQCCKPTTDYAEIEKDNKASQNSIEINKRKSDLDHYEKYKDIDRKTFVEDTKSLIYQTLGRNPKHFRSPTHESKSTDSLSDHHHKQSTMPSSVNRICSEQNTVPTQFQALKQYSNKCVNDNSANKISQNCKVPKRRSYNNYVDETDKPNIVRKDSSSLRSRDRFFSDPGRRYLKDDSNSLSVSKKEEDSYTIFRFDEDFQIQKKRRRIADKDKSHERYKIFAYNNVIELDVQHSPVYSKGVDIENISEPFEFTGSPKLYQSEKGCLRKCSCKNPKKGDYFNSPVTPTSAESGYGSYKSKKTGSLRKFFPREQTLLNNFTSSFNCFDREVYVDECAMFNSLYAVNTFPVNTSNSYTKNCSRRQSTTDCESRPSSSQQKRTSPKSSAPNSEYSDLPNNHLPRFPVFHFNRDDTSSSYWYYMGGKWADNPARCDRQTCKNLDKNKQNRDFRLQTPVGRTAKKSEEIEEQPSTSRKRPESPKRERYEPHLDQNTCDGELTPGENVYSSDETYKSEVKPKQKPIKIHGWKKHDQATSTANFDSNDEQFLFSSCRHKSLSSFKQKLRKDQGHKEDAKSEMDAKHLPFPRWKQACSKLRKEKLEKTQKLKKRVSPCTTPERKSSYAWQSDSKDSVKCLKSRFKELCRTASKSSEVWESDSRESVNRPKSRFRKLVRKISRPFYTSRKPNRDDFVDGEQSSSPTVNAKNQRESEPKQGKYLWFKHCSVPKTATSQRRSRDIAVGMSGTHCTRNLECLQKQIAQCHEYANKVCVQSRLSNKSHYKQFSDFKEIPLCVLLGKKTPKSPEKKDAECEDNQSKNQQPKLKILDDEKQTNDVLKLESVEEDAQDKNPKQKCSKFRKISFDKASKNQQNDKKVETSTSKLSKTKGKTCGMFVDQARKLFEGPGGCTRETCESLKKLREESKEPTKSSFDEDPEKVFKNLKNLSKESLIPLKELLDRVFERLLESTECEPSSEVSTELVRVPSNTSSNGSSQHSIKQQLELPYLECTPTTCSNPSKSSLVALKELLDMVFKNLLLKTSDHSVHESSQEQSSKFSKSPTEISLKQLSQASFEESSEIFQSCTTATYKNLVNLSRESLVPLKELLDMVFEKLLSNTSKETLSASIKKESSLSKTSPENYNKTAPKNLRSLSYTSMEISIKEPLKKSKETLPKKVLSKEAPRESFAGCTSATCSYLSKNSLKEAVPSPVLSVELPVKESSQYEKNSVSSKETPVKDLESPKETSKISTNDSLAVSSVEVSVQVGPEQVQPKQISSKEVMTEPSQFPFSGCTRATCKNLRSAKSEVPQNKVSAKTDKSAPKRSPQKANNKTDNISLKSSIGADTNSSRKGVESPTKVSKKDSSEQAAETQAAKCTQTTCKNKETCSKDTPFVSKGVQTEIPELVPDHLSKTADGEVELSKQADALPATTSTDSLEQPRKILPAGTSVQFLKSPSDSLSKDSEDELYFKLLNMVKDIEVGVSKHVVSSLTDCPITYSPENSNSAEALPEASTTKCTNAACKNSRKLSKQPLDAPARNTSTQFSNPSSDELKNSPEKAEKVSLEKEIAQQVENSGLGKERSKESAGRSSDEVLVQTTEPSSQPILQEMTFSNCSSKCKNLGSLSKESRELLTRTIQKLMDTSKDVLSKSSKEVLKKLIKILADTTSGKLTASDERHLSMELAAIYPNPKQSTSSLGLPKSTSKEGLSKESVLTKYISEHDKLQSQKLSEGKNQASSSSSSFLGCTDSTCKNLSNMSKESRELLIMAFQNLLYVSKGSLSQISQNESAQALESSSEKEATGSSDDMEEQPKSPDSDPKMSCENRKGLSRESRELLVNVLENIVRVLSKHSQQSVEAPSETSKENLSSASNLTGELQTFSGVLGHSFTKIPKDSKELLEKKFHIVANTSKKSVSVRSEDVMQLALSTTPGKFSPEEHLRKDVSATTSSSEVPDELLKRMCNVSLKTMVELYNKISDDKNMKMSFKAMVAELCRNKSKENSNVLTQSQLNLLDLLKNYQNENWQPSEDYKKCLCLQRKKEKSKEVKEKKDKDVVTEKETKAERQEVIKSPLLEERGEKENTPSAVSRKTVAKEEEYLRQNVSMDVISGDATTSESVPSESKDDTIIKTRGCFADVKIFEKCELSKNKEEETSEKTVDTSKSVQSKAGIEIKSQEGYIDIQSPEKSTVPKGKPKDSLEKLDKADALQKLRDSLTDKELFDKLLDSYEREESIVERLSNDEDFFGSQLELVKSKESAQLLLKDMERTSEEKSSNSSSGSEDPKPQTVEEKTLEGATEKISFESKENFLAKFSIDSISNTSAKNIPKNNSITDSKPERSNSKTKTSGLKSKVARLFKSDAVKEIVAPRKERLRSSIDESYVTDHNSVQKREEVQVHRNISATHLSPGEDPKVKFYKGAERFEEEKKMLEMGSEIFLHEVNLQSVQRKPAEDSTDAGMVKPSEIGKCFLRGFRSDYVSLGGDTCLLISKQERDRSLKRQSEKEDTFIEFSERDTPLEYLLALGFSIDEASSAIKDEDVKNRLFAAITEARIWINQINTVQGTLLYLIAYKAKPRIMRYYLQLVEAIINKRIQNAVKLDAFLRVLEKVEDGDLTMINIVGSDKFDDQENEEKIVKKQLRQLFINVYKTADYEANLKKKPLTTEAVVLLRILAAKYRAGLHPHLELIARYIGQGLIHNEVQLEAAMIYLSRLDTADVDLKEFEQYCGIVCAEQEKQGTSIPITASEKEVGEKKLG